MNPSKKIQGQKRWLIDMRRDKAEQIINDESLLGNKPKGFKYIIGKPKSKKRYVVEIVGIYSIDPTAKPKSRLNSSIWNPSRRKQNRRH